MITVNYQQYSSEPMKYRWKSILLFLLYSLIVLSLAEYINIMCNGICTIPHQENLILSVFDYSDSNLPSVWAILKNRVDIQPFNLVSLALFTLAICHTFFAHYFTVLSDRFRQQNIRENRTPVDSFGVEILHLLGEVEVIFGIWVIPLFLSIAYVYGWNSAIHYLDGRDYTEPLFVVIIITLASTAPILRLAEDSLRLVAKLGGETIQAWWWAILTIGPISGSLITEPGAMTISAILLGKQFYEYRPSKKLAYATLGLLFTNISVGGVFTNFAAPPVLMVSKAWGWDTSFMMQHFGWKAFLGILIVNATYFIIFRKEFSLLESRRKATSKEKIEEESEVEIPLWITIVHLCFLAWTVVHNHYPVIFLGTFLLFLGFYQATLTYQKVIDLKPAILVGFFLAGLVVHGTLQSWWISPILSGLTEETLLVMSTFLTSFNDNAAITFLASLIPDFSDQMKYAVVAGAVTGGGLTVIANAPNPAGQSILSKHFDQGVSAVSLLAGAIYPAAIMGIVFYLLRMI